MVSHGGAALFEGRKGLDVGYRLEQRGGSVGVAGR